MQMSRIRICTECDQYTLEGKCPKCFSKTGNTRPARFSPEDKWGKYRRMAKGYSHI